MTQVCGWNWISSQLPSIILAESSRPSVIRILDPACMHPFRSTCYLALTLTRVWRRTNVYCRVYRLYWRRYPIRPCTCLFIVSLVVVRRSSELPSAVNWKYAIVLYIENLQRAEAMRSTTNSPCRTISRRAPTTQRCPEALLLLSLQCVSLKVATAWQAKSGRDWKCKPTLSLISKKTLFEWCIG